MKRINTILIFVLTAIIVFPINIFSQDSATKNKINKIEEKQVADFVDDFLKSYQQTFDLTKIPKTFFVSDYQKRNTFPFFIDEYDKFLTEDEKFKNGSLWIDLAYVGFISKLSEFDFNLEKLRKSLDDENDDENTFFPKKMLELFEKYPKAKIFMHKNDFSQIKNVDDFRSAMKDFHSTMKELRDSLRLVAKSKLDKFFIKYKAKFIELKDVSKCSKEECGESLEKAKLFYYRVFTIDLMVAKDKSTMQIIKIIPAAD
ncbi:MAG TPA: hypothetical protein PKY82_05750 [Pyrinomonadaceae bacterium]|nr:hypothetical protein [Pyrinomonadaceae bacterium]